MLPLHATLLYRHPVEASAPGLADLMRDHGFAADGDGWRKGSLHLDLSVGGACPASDFTAALRQAHSGAYHGLSGAMIERHHAHLRITLTGAATSGKAHAAQLRLLHAVTRLMARSAAPMALHWSPSNQVLTGAQYDALCGVDSPWALFIHPHVQPAGHDIEGRPLTGFVLEGAEAFLGKPVAVAPSALPQYESLRLALSFVQFCFDKNHMLDIGQSLGRDKAQRIERLAGDDVIRIRPLVAERNLPLPPRAAARPAATGRWRAALLASGMATAATAATVALTMALAVQLIEPASQGFAASEISVTTLLSQN